MGIRVVCPNGHVLKVKDSLGGQTGLCPRCKARVEVPDPKRGDISEDAILDLLGSNSPPAGGQAAVAGPSAVVDSGSASEGEGSSPPKKVCHKCHREIQAGTHICPHCHTYIAGLTDF